MIDLLSDRDVAVSHDLGRGVLINLFSDVHATPGSQRSERVLIHFVSDKDAAVLAGEVQAEAVVYFVDGRVSVYGLHGCRRAIKCSQVDGRERSTGCAIVGQSKRLEVVGDGEVVTEGEIAGSAADLDQGGESVSPGGQIGAVQVVDVSSGVGGYKLTPMGDLPVLSSLVPSGRRIAGVLRRRRTTGWTGGGTELGFSNDNMRRALRLSLEVEDSNSKDFINVTTR